MPDQESLELPEPLLQVVHYYITAAHTLALAANEQPPELKGFGADQLLASAIEQISDGWQKTPREKQVYLLSKTAKRLESLMTLVSSGDLT